MKPDDPILKKCRWVLESLYRERLKGIVLYGSTARGTDTEESDIDLMVLLEGPVDFAMELSRMSDALYPLELDTDRAICVMPADAESYGKGEYSLFRNAQKEGVPV